MIRTLALAGGIAGAAVCSQYPEFAQQYLQRLAGQVDALEIVVTDFEASAMRAGLTRGQALGELTGTPFLADRQADMRRTFRRYAVLSDNLATLRVLDHESQLQAQAVQASQTAERLALAQYRAGTATYLSVVTAQQLSLTNQRTAAQLLARQLAASVALIAATGGGWHADATEAATTAAAATTSGT